jgi:hypothetical protein
MFPSRIGDLFKNTDSDSLQLNIDMENGITDPQSIAKDKKIKTPLGQSIGDYNIARTLAKGKGSYTQLLEFKHLLDAIAPLKYAEQRIHAKYLLLVFDVENSSTSIIDILDEFQLVTSKSLSYLGGRNQPNNQVMLVLIAQDLFDFKDLNSLQFKVAKLINVRVTRNFKLLSFLIGIYTNNQLTYSNELLKVTEFKLSSTAITSLKNTMLLENDISILVDTGNLSITQVAAVVKGASTYNGALQYRLLSMAPKFYNMTIKYNYVNLEYSIWRHEHCKFRLHGPQIINGQLLRNKLSHLYIYGPSSTGKTTWANLLLSKWPGLFYNKQDSQYQQITPEAQLLIFDEFRKGDISIDKLLVLCDGTSNLRQIYGSPINFRGTVIILSMLGPSQLEMSYNDAAAFYNRFNVYNLTYDSETNNVMCELEKILAGLKVQCINAIEAEKFTNVVDDNIKMLRSQITNGMEEMQTLIAEATVYNN